MVMHWLTEIMIEAKVFMLLWGSGGVNGCGVRRALGAAKTVYCFPRYTSVTVIVSMGLTSIPITSKSYLQFTSLLMCLYHLCWVLSSSDDELMEFYDSGC